MKQETRRTPLPGAILLVAGVLFVAMCIGLGVSEWYWARSAAIPAPPAAAATAPPLPTAPAAAVRERAAHARPPIHTATSRAGASRAMIQHQYEVWGFEFVDSPLADGRARAMGTSAEGWVVVEIIGTPAAATQASAMLAPAPDAAQQQRNLDYVTALPALIAPDWQSGTAWLHTNLDDVLQALQRGEAVSERTFSEGGRTISMHTHLMSGVTMVVTTVNVQ